MENKIKQIQMDILEFIKQKYILDIDGAIQTEIPNLDLYFSKKLSEFNAIMYEPSLCIILQGSKAVGFGDELFSYDSKEYLLSATHIPAIVKILEANEEVPYVSFRIKFDMEDIYPMQRLVQGDVGSGKTVIAALALVKTVENGYQGAMMAPTEILAEQHYASLCKMFKEFPINVELLTGSLPRSQKEKVLAQISSGNADIIVGTHA